MFTLQEIAERLGAAVPIGAENVKIAGLATLADARSDELSFIGDARYIAQSADSKAAAFVVQSELRLPESFAKLVLPVKNADLAIARIAEMFAPPPSRPPQGVHAAAQVDSSAELGSQVAVGPHVCIGARAKIGARTTLHAGVFVGDDTWIGEDCELFPNVVVRERCILGRRVIVHACSAIGSDGFGYRWDGTKHAKILQIGIVEIEDDVEIGSCSCVDRAKFGVTRVGRGTKVDNLVQIAHNVTIGPHCILAGQAGTAGSVTLGAGVVLGGQSAIKDHARMGDRSMLAACSGVLDDIEPGQIVSGVPAIPHRQHLRELAALKHLPGLRLEVRKLKEELEDLKKRVAPDK